MGSSLCDFVVQQRGIFRFFFVKSVFARILSFKKLYLEKAIVFLPLSHSVN